MLKALELAAQFEVLRLSYFDPAPHGQAMSECAALLTRLDKQPSRVQPTYLCQRLRAALEYLVRKGNTDTFEDELRTLVQELKAQGMTSGEIQIELAGRGMDRKLAEINRVWN